MSVKLKLAAYVILASLALWFGVGFYTSFQSVAPIQIVVTGDSTNDQPATPATLKTDNPNQAASAQTNANDLAATDSAATNSSPATNAVAPTPAPTNATDLASTDSTSTNEPPGTNTVQPATAQTNTTAARKLLAKKKKKTHHAIVVTQSSQSRSVGDLAALVVTLIGLGGLVAYDVSEYFGSRAVDVLFNDEGIGARDPEYEHAEQVWVNGKPLEAIQMMRDYLKKHPREQYVALRIAEIYEKDLRNYVAASLEYEEVLKKRLPAERWGWAAIHLCNIYHKLDQPDKTRALLERIADEYPQTGAAKKARRNLGLAEPEEAPAAAPEIAEDASANPDGAHVFDLDEAIASTEGESTPPSESRPKAPPPADPSKQSLPPGFRPK